MQTLFLPAPPFLSSYISHRVVLTAPCLAQEIIIPLVANGYPGIVFQSTGANGMGELKVYGQTVRPIEFSASKDLTLIAYFLYPPMLNAFFGVGAKELTDRQIDLDLLQPGRGTSLKERLRNTLDLPSRLTLLDDLVRSLVKDGLCAAHNAIVYATQVIQKTGMPASLNGLQKELCVTERTFQRMFETYVGVTPKMFRKICQFDAALKMMHQQKFTRLADLAYAHDYADPSHFTRVFREFTNRSPKEYLQAMPDASAL